MLPAEKFNPRDYEQKREDDVVTYPVGGVPIMVVRDLRTFWDNYGCVDIDGRPDDKLICDGFVTIANPDMQAPVSAIHINLNMSVVFYRGKQQLLDKHLNDILIAPRDKNTLTEEANGAFRDLIERQVPHAAYKNLDPREWLLAPRWHQGHQKILAQGGVETGKYALCLARFTRIDTEHFEPVRELCNAEALSSDPKIRSAVHGLLASFFRQGTEGLPGIAQKFLPVPEAGV